MIIALREPEMNERNKRNLFLINNLSPKKLIFWRLVFFVLLSPLPAFAAEVNHIAFDSYETTGRPASYSFAPLAIIDQSLQQGKKTNISLVELSSNNIKSFKSGIIKRHGKSNLYGTSSSMVVDFFGKSTNQTTKEINNIFSGEAHLATTHFYLSSLVAETTYDAVLLKTKNSKSKFKSAIYKSAKSLALIGGPGILAYEMSSLVEAVVKDFRSSKPGFNAVTTEFASLEAQSTMMKDLASWGMAAKNIKWLKLQGASPFMSLLKRTLPAKNYKWLTSIMSGAKISQRAANVGKFIYKGKIFSIPGLATTFAELTAVYTLAHYWKSTLQPIVVRGVNSYKRGKFISLFKESLENLHDSNLTPRQFSSITSKITNSMQKHRNWLVDEKRLDMMPQALASAILQAKILYLNELNKLPIETQLAYVYQEKKMDDIQTAIKNQLLDEYISREVRMTFNNYTQADYRYKQLLNGYFNKGLKGPLRKKQLLSRKAAQNKARHKFESMAQQLNARYDRLIDKYEGQIADINQEVETWAKTLPEDLGFDENNRRTMPQNVDLDAFVSYDDQVNNISPDSLLSTVDDKNYSFAHLHFLQQIFYSYVSSNFVDQFPRQVSQLSAERLIHIYSYMFDFSFYATPSR